MTKDRYCKWFVPNSYWLFKAVVVGAICLLCFSVQGQKKKSTTKGAKKAKKNQVETRPDKDEIRKKAKKEQRGKIPGRTRKVNPLSRSKGISKYQSEKKLHTRRVKRRRNALALPNRNPIEWKVPKRLHGTKLDRQIRNYQGNIKQPTLRRSKQLAKQHSREIMNFSGKLSIAKPNNSRKHYFKISRKTALFQGNMKIKWLHFHHRHPSLWRMGRNERPSSREVYINRKMAKKPKYNPKEREIWSKPREVPKATMPEEKEEPQEEEGGN